MGEEQREQQIVNSTRVIEKSVVKDITKISTNSAQVGVICDNMLASGNSLPSSNMVTFPKTTAVGALTLDDYTISVGELTSTHVYGIGYHHDATNGHRVCMFKVARADNTFTLLNEEILDANAKYTVNYTYLAMDFTSFLIGTQMYSVFPYYDTVALMYELKIFNTNISTGVTSQVKCSTLTASFNSAIGNYNGQDAVNRVTKGRGDFICVGYNNATYTENRMMTLSTTLTLIQDSLLLSDTDAQAYYQPYIYSSDKLSCGVLKNGTLRAGSSVAFNLDGTFTASTLVDTSTTALYYSFYPVKIGSNLEVMTVRYDAAQDSPTTLINKCYISNAPLNFATDSFTTNAPNTHYLYHPIRRTFGFPMKPHKMIDDGVGTIDFVENAIKQNYAVNGNITIGIRKLKYDHTLTDPNEVFKSIRCEIIGLNPSWTNIKLDSFVAPESRNAGYFVSSNDGDLVPLQTVNSLFYSDYTVENSYQISGITNKIAIYVGYTNDNEHGTMGTAGDPHYRCRMTISEDI